MSEARTYQFKELGRRLSNWNRWGPDDQRGTVNFITPEVRVRAAAAIRSGRVFDLGMPFDAAGPQAGGQRFNPVHTMAMLPSDGPLYEDGLVVADDVITMPLQCATQWDGLAHVGYDGMLYNGVPANAVTAKSGAVRDSFESVVCELVGRGVLLDIAHLKGQDRLQAKDQVTADELESACVSQGVQVGSGDIVLVRTGWYQHFLEGDKATYLSSTGSPGLGISCAQWLADREIAAVCCDNYAVECRPSTESGASLPLHMVLIRDMGMTLGEMFCLEQLAADCRNDGTWEFFFSGIGLKITGAVGSPVSPIAIK